MIVLITGGAGFIGSHLAERLLAATAHSLVLLDNFNDYYDPRLKQANVAPITENQRVTIVPGDFRDAVSMARLFRDYGVEQVIHLGAFPGVPFSVLHPQWYIETNVGGTLSLLEAAREHPVERFLFASSSTVYGRG